jgi:hypothetical protein
MAKDFRASQVETSKIIMSGSLGPKNLGLVIYSGSIATDRAGTVSDTNMLQHVGEDVGIFVSGTMGSKASDTGGVVFGGDTYQGRSTLVVKTSMHFSEKAAQQRQVGPYQVLFITQRVVSSIFSEQVQHQ